MLVLIFFSHKGGQYFFQKISITQTIGLNQVYFKENQNNLFLNTNKQKSYRRFSLRMNAYSHSCNQVVSEVHAGKISFLLTENLR